MWFCRLKKHKMVKIVSLSHDHVFQEIIVKPQKKRLEELNPAFNPEYKENDLVSLLRSKLKNKGKGNFTRVMVATHPSSGGILHVWAHHAGTMPHPEYKVGVGKAAVSLRLFDDVMFVLCKEKVFVFDDILDVTVEDCEKVLDEIFEQDGGDTTNDVDDADDDSDGGYFDDAGSDAEDDAEDDEGVEGVIKKKKNVEKEDDDASIVELFTEDLTGGDLLDAAPGGFRPENRLEFEAYIYPPDLEARALLPSRT